MPTNLTGNPATFPTQTAPVGGDPRTASSVSTPLQNAADRTEYLKSIADAHGGVDGVRYIRRYASLTALRASTDHVANSYVMVDGLGMYRFDTSINGAIPLAFINIVKPDDVLDASFGRWVHTLYSGYAGQAYGAASLDDLAKVPVAQLRNVITQFVNQPRVSVTLPASSGVAVGTAKTLTNLVAGDVVIVGAYVDGDSANGFAELQPSTTTNLTYQSLVLKFLASASFGVSGTAAYPVTGPIASVNWSMSATDISGASSTVEANWYAYVVRP